MLLWQAYIRSYDRLGNDPYVGRRLVSLLHEAGAVPTRNNWVFFGGCAGNPVFADIPTNWLIASPTPAYTTAFVALLADQLAAVNSGVATLIGSRAIRGIEMGETRSLYAPLACRLLVNERTGKVQLGQNTLDALSTELPRLGIGCPN